MEACWRPAGAASAAVAVLVPVRPLLCLPPDVPAEAGRCPAGTPVPSAWREGGRVLGSLGQKVLCPRAGLTPHIYDLNLYGARRGSKCLLYCCVQTQSGVVNRLFYV